MKGSRGGARTSGLRFWAIWNDCQGPFEVFRTRRAAIAELESWPDKANAEIVPVSVTRLNRKQFEEENRIEDDNERTWL